MSGVQQPTTSPHGGEPMNAGGEPLPNAGGAPPVQGTPAAQGHDQAGGQTSAEPFAVFKTKEAFEERLSRDSRSRLQKELSDLGISSREELESTLQAAKEFKKQEEERRQQQMSEVEKANAQHKEALARAEKFEKSYNDSQFDLQVLKTCSEIGIKDWRYARYRLLEKRSEMQEGETLDEKGYLQELAKDPVASVALGLASPPPQITQTPATTTPVTGAPPGTPGGPPNPSPVNQHQVPKDAMQMTDAEWEAKKRALLVS